MGISARRQHISLDVQIFNVKKRFPDFSTSKQKEMVTWIGYLQPTPMSSKYKIKIQYSPRNVHPKIWVIFPELIKRIDQDKIPHTYNENRLCLFLPGTGEWTRDKLISDTIIPWASLWLYYYEVWHATGDWLGGGVHPLGNKGALEKGE